MDKVSKARMVAKEAFEGLFEDRARVIVRKPIKDDVTKITSLQEVMLKEISCRLSFGSEHHSSRGSYALGEGEMKLYTSPSSLIPLGSKVLVLREGVSYALTVSKVIAYKTHDEYICKEFVKWV